MKMDRRSFLKAATTAGASFAIGGAGNLFGAPLASEKNRSLKQKPNVIFIMTDDMGYETIGYNKATNYKTPHLDKFAKESFVFTNCDAQPLCCPTRVKLVTGQLNYSNYSGWGSFDLHFPAIGEMMQRAGYATAVFGKWHLNKPP